MREDAAYKKMRGGCRAVDVGQSRAEHEYSWCRQRCREQLGGRGYIFFDKGVDESSPNPVWQSNVVHIATLTAEQCPRRSARTETEIGCDEQTEPPASSFDGSRLGSRAGRGKMRRLSRWSRNSGSSRRIEADLLLVLFAFRRARVASSDQKSRPATLDEVLAVQEVRRRREERNPGRFGRASGRSAGPARGASSDGPTCVRWPIDLDRAGDNVARRQQASASARTPACVRFDRDDPEQLTEHHAGTAT